VSKRLVTVEDVQRFEWPANPVLSPCGQWVVFEKTVADPKEDGYNTQLMLAKADGTELRVLTSSGTSNTGAVWSPDGRYIAFVSNRAYGAQVWLLPLWGGEARQLTRFRHGMNALAWSPDGKTLYGLVPAERGKDVEVFEDGLTDKEAKEQTEKQNKEWVEGPKRYDRLYYKLDGVGFFKGFVPQLVAVDVEIGTYRQLTRGEEGIGSFSVSPDGQFIAFTANFRENPDETWWASDIYRISTEGGQPELLSSDVIGYHVAYSPDGKHLAVVGHGDEFFTYWSATHLHLFLLPADGGPARHLTKAFPDTLDDTNLTDMRPNARSQEPAWSKDGKYIYALSTREGRSEVVRFPTDGDGSTAEVVIGGDRDVFGFAFDGDTRFVISYATPTHPGKIASVDISGAATRTRRCRKVTEPMATERVPFFPSDEIRLDTCSDKLVEELILVEPEPFWYQSSDDWYVQGWVMKPAEFEEGKKYPVILEIHGGPQLNYGYAMFHEMQWFASQGYAVVFTNPRGGMSYGQEFVNAVRHHYGQNDAADVLKGIEAAISQFDFLDGSRVAVTGGSYGGFMTNWLVGHTHRFFAAVSQRSISNWISFYGTSDVGPLFVESQLGCNIYEDIEKLWEMSPLAYVKEVETPLLLIHSENDLRCPIEQAEEFYTALKRLGKEVSLVRVPNASHGLSRNGKPKLRIARLNHIFNYINERLPKSE
jgi:dipeptidyl aminopeptidase/acylaminoacyl peptidase